MSWYHPTTLFDKIFEGGLLIKGTLATAEFLAGLALFFVSPNSIHKFLAFITQRELSGDPHDKLAHFILHSADSLNVSNKNFVIAYLWVLAFVKLIAVVGILRNVLWVYPFSLVTLGAVMLYQVYSIILKTSIGLILLTAFDIFILFMIWREYGKARAKLSEARSTPTDDG